MTRWTQADVDAIRNRREATVGKRSKYGAQKTVVDGIVFDSKRESQRYHELKLMQLAGEITGLELQPAFDLVVRDTFIGKYLGDFRYADKRGNIVIEDVKSSATRTPLYRLKRKIVEAIYHIEITEVT